MKLRGGGTGGEKAFDGGVKMVARRLSEGGHAKSCMAGDSEFVQNFGLMQRTRERQNTYTGNIFQKMFDDEKGNGIDETSAQDPTC